MKQPLDNQNRTDVSLLTFFQCCFVDVEKTSIKIRWFNFHFQPNINVETRLIHLRWIDVILLTLFQGCFANVKTTSIEVLWLNFNLSTKYQQWCTRCVCIYHFKRFNLYNGFWLVYDKVKTDSDLHHTITECNIECVS